MIIRAKRPGGAAAAERSLFTRVAYAEFYRVRRDAQARQVEHLAERERNLLRHTELSAFPLCNVLKRRAPAGAYYLLRGGRVTQALRPLRFASSDRTACSGCVPQLHCCAGALQSPARSNNKRRCPKQSNFFLAEGISTRGRLAARSGSTGPAPSLPANRKTCKTRALACNRLGRG